MPLDSSAIGSIQFISHCSSTFFVENRPIHALALSAIDKHSEKASYCSRDSNPLQPAGVTVSCKPTSAASSCTTVPSAPLESRARGSLVTATPPWLYISHPLSLRRRALLSRVPLLTTAAAAAAVIGSGGGQVEHTSTGGWPCVLRGWPHLLRRQGLRG